ncbi:unnamed protein product [Musa hybrid cultivar]
MKDLKIRSHKFQIMVLFFNLVIDMLRVLCRWKYGSYKETLKQAVTSTNQKRRHYQVSIEILLEDRFAHGCPLIHSGCSSPTGLSAGPEIRTPVSHVPQAGAADLPIASGSMVARSDSRQSAKCTHTLRNQVASKYNHLGSADSSEKREWTLHLLDGHSSSHKKDDRKEDKESTTGVALRTEFTTLGH